MVEGLELLSNEIARSSVLTQFRPIEMIASRGFMAVM